MPQLDQLSACPGCGEPLDEDDRFCGVCGTDLSAAARSASPGSPAAAEHPPGYTPTEHDFPLPPPLRQSPPPAAPAPPAPPAPPAAAPPAPPAPTGRTGPGAGPASQPPPSADQAPYGTTRAPAPPAAPAPAPTGQAPTGQAPDPRAHPPAAPPAGSPPPPGQPGQPGQPAQPAAPRATPRGTDPRAGAAPARARCASCGRADAEAAGGQCADCARERPADRNHVERALGGVAAVSDLGRRHHRNEDAFSVAATALGDGTPAVVAVVCDGVSSSTRPHEASAAAAEAAAESLLTALPRGVAGELAMHAAVLAAADAVNQLADTAKEPGRNSPACTIVSAVTAGNQLIVGWIGDSRAYWVPKDGAGRPARLTEDDSWAAQMVAAGLLSEAEAMADHRAHAITAWLGADAQEVEPHTATFRPDHPGTVIVCTDGLWNYADAAERMAELLAGAGPAPLPTAQQLVRYALDSGGHDNVTVAVIPFPSPPASAD